jgi:hypothetical protein
MLGRLRPIYMVEHWAVKLAINVAIMFACAAIVYLYQGQEARHKRSLELSVKWAYKQGYAEATRDASDVDYKKLALSDRAYSSKLCKAWWFDATAQEKWK